MSTQWETRLRGNTPKFIDIFPVGAADSSGAIARIPIRDGYFSSNHKTARLIAAAPRLKEALTALIEERQPLGIEREAYQTAIKLLCELDSE